jgi:hypothetical protein
MDLSLLLEGITLVVAASAVAAALLWLRLGRRLLDEHRAAIAEMARAQEHGARAVDAAIEAVHLARQTAEDVPRRAAYPYLHGDLVRSADRSHLVLSNPGTVPAMRATVLAVAQYAGDPSLSTFLDTYVDKDQVDPWLAAHGLAHGTDDGKTFGVVYERAYPLFPAGRRATYALNLPVVPRHVFLLLQFESVLGDNYVHLYRFASQHAADPPALLQHRLATRTPTDLRPQPRIDTVEHNGRFALLNVDAPAAAGDGSALPCEDPSLPDFLRDELLLSTLNRSMPARFLKRERAVAQDREVWTDLAAGGGIS